MHEVCEMAGRQKWSLRQGRILGLEGSSGGVLFTVIGKEEQI